MPQVTVIQRRGDGLGMVCPRRRWLRAMRCAAALLPLLIAAGCASIRVTDPPQTATEQFLMTEAATRAITQLSAESLRGRRAYVDSTYLTAAAQPSQQHSFLLGELRANLLLAGVQLANRREDAQIIVEVRSGGVGIDRVDYLLGIPSIYVPGTGSTTGAVPLITPELAIVKNTKQKGYAGVTIVAYWADTGEAVASSGPHVGRTRRSDWWFFGFGPQTSGDIPTTTDGSD